MINKLLELVFGHTKTGQRNKGSVTINGQSFSGDLIIVGNSSVIVDGVETRFEPSPQLFVSVVGDCQSLTTTSGDVTIKGDAGHIHTVSGDVRVENGVSNGVQTVSGDVSAYMIGGQIRTTSGDIYCGGK